MKSMDKIVRSLRAANPGSPKRQHALSGSGHWLYWLPPSGERILIGVSLNIGGTNYRRLPAPEDDYQDTVAALWGDDAVWQLDNLIAATAMALHQGQPLPTGISADPLPFCHGDNPRQMLDRLWRHGPAHSILLKKKPPSHAERSSDENTPAAEPAAPATSSHAGNDQEASPATRGAKGHKR